MQCPKVQHPVSWSSFSLAASSLACEQAHLWVKHANGGEQSDPAGRSRLAASPLNFALAARACISTWACSQPTSSREREILGRHQLNLFCFVFFNQLKPRNVEELSLIQELFSRLYLSRSVDVTTREFCFLFMEDENVFRALCALLRELNLFHKIGFF